MDEIFKPLVSGLIQVLSQYENLAAWGWSLQTLFDVLNADEIQEIFHQLQLPPEKKKSIIDALQDQSNQSSDSG